MKGTGEKRRRDDKKNKLIVERRKTNNFFWYSAGSEIHTQIQSAINVFKAWAKGNQKEAKINKF